jgi:hypothetical protein
VRIFGVPGQIVRIAIFLALAIVALLFVRQQFVPESFGDIGHYRADVVPIIAAQEIRYAGLEACAECHVDEAEVKQSSYHRGLTCEGCHGAAADHADDPTERQPYVPKGREACLRCHSYLAARPTGFPQIIERVHNPMEGCAGCHDPHDPTPPEVPGECSACHGLIPRTKSVSHHWSLGCETCHDTPEGHREHPRAALPQKPAERTFCGTCHAVDAASSGEIPRVDIREHGGRYLCWQCHYPHDPEGR